MFEVKFADKVLLTTSNVPANFRWSNQNRLGEKCKKCDFFRCKMAAISLNPEYLGLNFALHSGTTQGTCVQNIIGISAKLRAVG